MVNQKRALLVLLLALAPLAARAEEGPPLANALALRAGVFLLTSPAVPGHPAGPDLEASWSHVIWDLVALELAGGAYLVTIPNSGSRLEVAPLSLSVKISAAPERGWAAYGVVGLGVSFTRLTGGSYAEPVSADFTYLAGLGVTHPWGERHFFGVDGRYVFHDVGGALGRVDGLRLSALLGSRF
jgi:hypothetical protein